jgi:hypothetical protein
LANSEISILKACTLFNLNNDFHDGAPALGAMVEEADNTPGGFQFIVALALLYLKALFREARWLLSLTVGLRRLLPSRLGGIRISQPRSGNCFYND